MPAMRRRECSPPRRKSASGGACDEPIQELVEDRRVERSLEMEPGIGALYPRHLGAQRFESGQAHNHPLSGTHHFNQFDAAAVGRDVARRELEAEAAELFYGDFLVDGNPAASAATPFRALSELPSRDCPARSF
jgi:hypothetical protein